MGANVLRGQSTQDNGNLLSVWRALLYWPEAQNPHDTSVALKYFPVGQQITLPELSKKSSSVIRLDQTLSHQMWANNLACLNIDPVFTTRDISHLVTSRLNTLAVWNTAHQILKKKTKVRNQD